MSKKERLEEEYKTLKLMHKFTYVMLAFLVFTLIYTKDYLITFPITSFLFANYFTVIGRIKKLIELENEKDGK